MNVPYEIGRMRDLGLIVTLVDAEPLRVGAVVSRYLLRVVDPRTAEAVGGFRATREGEWLGGGWIETPNGRQEVRRFTDVLPILEARRGAAA